MRVLHVMADGAPGGGPTVVQTLVEQLARRGVNSAIVTQRGSALHEAARAGGVRVHGLDFSLGRGAIPLPGQLDRILDNERIDLVHAHGARSAAPVALLPRGRRPAFVYTVHGFHYRHRPALQSDIGRRLEQFCIRRVDNVVFVSTADLAHARESGLLGSTRGSVIYNGVEVPKGLARPAGARDFDLAFVGRVHPQKDPLILPDILLALRPLRPSLLIVGSGPLDQALEAKIVMLGLGDQVFRSAALPRTEALAQLARARVMVLPSLWEGLPLALAEAMLLRVAVVASAIAGNDEIVTDGVTGRLAPAGDAAAFAREIARLLADPLEWRALTECAAVHAGRKFSLNNQIDAHLALYLELVEARASASRGVTVRERQVLEAGSARVLH